MLVPSKGSGDTNLACIIRANSSLVCLGRPSLGVMRADHWRNTSSYTWHPIQGTKVSGEDPMLWLDQAEEDGTEVLHAVLHGGGPLKESFLDESCGHDVACTLPQAGLRQTSRRPHEIQRRRMNVFSPGTAFGATPRR